CSAGRTSASWCSSRRADNVVFVRHAGAGAAAFCGAGFIPADGGGSGTHGVDGSPPAGIKPAPQGTGYGPPPDVLPARRLFVGPGSSRPTGVGLTPMAWIKVRRPA